MISPNNEPHNSAQWARKQWRGFKAGMPGTMRPPSRTERLKLALLVCKCQHGAAPSYLADELRQPADCDARRRLRTASSLLLIDRRTRLSTIGDRAFPVAAAARVWNGLPHYVTLAPSLAVFRSRLKTHLFRRCFPSHSAVVHLCLRCDARHCRTH